MKFSAKSNRGLVEALAGTHFGQLIERSMTHFEFRRGVGVAYWENPVLFAKGRRTSISGSSALAALLLRYFMTYTTSRRKVHLSL